MLLLRIPNPDSPIPTSTQVPPTPADTRTMDIFSVVGLVLALVAAAAMVMPRRVRREGIR